jgi:hypothetical protein
MKRVKMVLSACAPGDGDDIRKDARQPRHPPFRAFREHALLVDADMNRVLAGSPVAKLVIL